MAISFLAYTVTEVRNQVVRLYITKHDPASGCFNLNVIILSYSVYVYTRSHRSVYLETRAGNEGFVESFQRVTAHRVVFAHSSFLAPVIKNLAASSVHVFFLVWACIKWIAIATPLFRLLKMCRIQPHCES